jgi:hypothetical protein
MVVQRGICQPKPHRPCLRRAHSVLGAQGVAIHGRGVVVGRRKPGPNGFGRHPAVGFGQRDGFAAERLPQMSRFQRRAEGGPGLIEGDVFEVEFAFHTIMSASLC